MRDSAAGIDDDGLSIRAASFSVISAMRWASPAASRFVVGHRRAVVAAVALIGWLPLAILVIALEPHSFRLFAQDYPVHVRSLFAAPWLILIDRMVDGRIGTAVRHLVSAQMVPPSDRARLDRALARIERLRDSRWVAAALIVAAVVGAIYSATHSIGMPQIAWARSGAGRYAGFSLAGWWYVAVSLPLFQVLLFAWVWRWVLWVVLLASISRLDLRLLGGHPDHAGGLGFLSVASVCFAIAALGPATILSSSWTRSIVVEHSPVTKFWPLAALEGAIVVALVFLPLVLFARRLRALQQRDRPRYARLVQRYYARFDRLWTSPDAPRDDQALEPMDAQDVVNLGNLHQDVLAMRFIPYERAALFDLVAAVVVPMVPMFLASSSVTSLAKLLVRTLL